MSAELPLPLPLDECLEILLDLGRRQAAPDDALATLGLLRRRHPQLELELVWTEEPYLRHLEYDLLVTQAEVGTVSLGVTSGAGVPFPLRGVQRWREGDLVRVNGRVQALADTIALFDDVWNDRRLLEGVVDHCLVQQELEARGIDFTDEELQAEVDAYRLQRGLLTADETLAWLAARGWTQQTVERAAESRLCLREVRRRWTGGAARAAFDADPTAYDLVRLVAFAPPDPGAALRELAAGADLLTLAERLVGNAATRGERSVRVEAVRRRDLAVLEGTLGAGAAVVARIEDAGPYVARVTAVTPATWDDATREVVEDKLFREELARRRAAAHVQWNWGPAA